MSQEETPELLFKLLTMRDNGEGFDDIGKELGFTRNQLALKVTKLKEQLKAGNFTLIKQIAAYSNKPSSEIAGLIKKKYIHKNATRMFWIKIKEQISNNNLWYYHHKNQEFEAKRKLSSSYYYVTDFLKVRQKDCIEIKK